MASHRAVHVDAANGPLQLVDVETTPPPPHHVRIAVHACGICGTDREFAHGAFPDMTWPLTPGHEIAGTIAELGDGVEGLSIGDRVAVGWFGGNCNHCEECRNGLFMHYENGQVPSWHYPGGYAHSVTAPATALARIPEGLSFTEAAPMGCAGVTTYHALRSTKAVSGDRVAVLGLGGLGHLGVQFARAMGFETIAIARRRRQGGRRAPVRRTPLHRLHRCRRRRSATPSWWSHGRPRHRRQLERHRPSTRWP
jgi:alcohol dehydrogenase